MNKQKTVRCQFIKINRRIVPMLAITELPTNDTWYYTIEHPDKFGCKVITVPRFKQMVTAWTQNLSRDTMPFEEFGVTANVLLSGIKTAQTVEQYIEQGCKITLSDFYGNKIPLLTTEQAVSLLDPKQYELKRPYRIDFKQGKRKTKK